MLIGHVVVLVVFNWIAHLLKLEFMGWCNVVADDNVLVVAEDLKASWCDGLESHLLFAVGSLSIIRKCALQLYFRVGWGKGRSRILRNLRRLSFSHWKRHNITDILVDCPRSRETNGGVRVERAFVEVVFTRDNLSQGTVILNRIWHSPWGRLILRISMDIVLVCGAVAWKVVAAWHWMRWHIVLLLAVATKVYDITLLIILRHS